jgi:hypothetical protein
MSETNNFHLTFTCTDHYNENHELKTNYTFENGSYKDQLDKLRQFQHDINSLMTQFVNKEKADAKEKGNKSNSGNKSDEEHYKSDESEDEQQQVSNESEIDKKKPKLN